MGDHHCLTVTPKGVFEEACQLRVSVVDVVGVV